MARAILVKPGEKPEWVDLPWEFSERGEAIRAFVGGSGFECYNGGGGWVVYGSKDSKQRGEPVNTSYLAFHRRHRGIPGDETAGPVLLCGVNRWGDEVTPDESLRTVFGELWPKDEKEE